MSAPDRHPDTGELRPPECCGACPPIKGGGYDCTCVGNPRCGAAPDDLYDDLYYLKEG